MKTALVLLVSEDGSSGKVLTGLIPCEEAVAKAREISKAAQTDPAFPVVEVWSGAIRRFAIAPAAKPVPASEAEPVAEPTEESTAKSRR